jgi:hypothetical protein
MFWVLIMCGSEKAQLFTGIYSLCFQGRKESQTTNQQKVKLRLILLLLVSCLAYSLTLKMEAICSSEMLCCLQTTWCNNLDNHTLHIYKSHMNIY